MHRLRDHALSVSNEWKTWVAVIALTNACFMMRHTNGQALTCAKISAATFNGGT